MMSDQIQEAFGLSRRPFDKSVPADLLWMDSGRQQGLDRLVQTIEHRQHALVTGEPGVGKTCVLRALRERLAATRFRLDYVSHVSLGRRDFYRQICLSLGIEAKATPAAMFEAIQRSLANSTHEHRQHAVLVLDEAHLIPDATLCHIHVLANFEWDSQPLLSLVFVGLPELHDRLRLGIHRSLLTRLHTRLELSPGSAEMTTAYVRKRLSDAGARSELFTSDGLAMLHELTGGLLRSVDVLAQAALRVAAADDTALVDRHVVRRALATTPLA
jgi:type II secretory pathway predicted ATPase ExeA